MSYVKVKFLEYVESRDEFLFEVFDDNSPTPSYKLMMTGECIARLKQEYDNTPDKMGQGMPNRDVAIMCIVHDHEEAPAELTPAELVGRSYEIDD